MMRYFLRVWKSERLARLSGMLSIVRLPRIIGLDLDFACAHAAVGRNLRLCGQDEIQQIPRLHICLLHRINGDPLAMT